MSSRELKITAAALYLLHWLDSQRPTWIIGKEKRSMRLCRNVSFSFSTTNSFALWRIFTPAKEIMETKARKMKIERTLRFILRSPQTIKP